jgi:hypothetical protein
MDNPAPQMTSEEVMEELTKMAYSRKDFEQLVTLVYAMPNQFWTDVCKRLIATCLVVRHQATVHK